MRSATPSRTALRDPTSAPTLSQPAWFHFVMTGGSRSRRASPRSRRCCVSSRNERRPGACRHFEHRVRRNVSHGFTLIELLVVIAIIATLAAVVAPSIFGNVGDARRSAAKSQIEILALALDQYRLDNDAYPTTQQGLDAL